MKNTIHPNLNQKGTEMWWIIVMGIIALIAVIVIVVFFNGSVGRSKDIVDENFDGFGDTDCDKVADFTDACPDDSNIQTKEQKESNNNACGNNKLCASTSN